MENIRGGSVWVWGLQYGKWIIRSDLWDDLTRQVYRMAKCDQKLFDWRGLPIAMEKVSDAYEGNILCVPRTNKGELLALHDVTH